MTEERMIAFYCSSLTRGGAERVFVNLAEYFRGKGYRVSIVTQYRHEEEYAVHPEIMRVVLQEELGAEPNGRIRNFIHRFLCLRRIFDRIRPDLVFSCNGKNNFMAQTANAFRRRKVVVSVIATPSEEYYTKPMRFLAKLLFRFTDGIVFQTKEAMQYFPKAVQKKAVILPNSVNPLFIRPRYEGERKKEIVAVGRLDDNKNQEMLIRAFAGVAEAFPEYAVTIYGEGENRKKLESLVRELKMESRIFLPGQEKNIADKLYKSSLFVMTSNTEGMPNALLEAMSLGLPVISTDCPCGGPREIIRHGENGYLIPVGDTKALGRQLKECLSDPEKTEEAGRQAAQIQRTMNPETVNLKWEKYFCKVMGQ